MSKVYGIVDNFLRKQLCLSKHKAHNLEKKHNSIVRINLIDYAVPQIAKANLGRTEEQLMVRV